MPTEKRGSDAGVMQRLFDRPHQFKFVQAVRLLERWLVQHGVPREAALTRYVRFQNSISLGFPASEIEALLPELGVAGGSEADMLAALHSGALKHIHITPAFIGFLGAQGVLPNHYTERIAAKFHLTKDAGPRAFFDLFSNRIVALFYQAWRKYRLELPHGVDGQDGLLPLLLLLSGTPAGSTGQPVPDEVAAYYAAAFRQRPTSPLLIERVLADYFGIPVKVEPNLGHWQNIAPALQARMGGKIARLNVSCLLGPRTWRRDMRARIKLGPLSRAQHAHFLPGSEGAAALKNMLSMFATPTLQYEVRLVLRAADIGGVCLSPTADGGGARLNRDAFLAAGPGGSDRDDAFYIIDAL